MNRAYYKPRDPGSLKGAQAELVAACGGKDAAQHTRVKKSVLLEYTDPASPARNMPVDVVLDLEKIACPHAQNHLLVALPASDAGPYAHLLSRITTELGDLLAGGAESIRLNRVTASGARRLKAYAMQVSRPLAALIADCDGVIEGRAP